MTESQWGLIFRAFRRAVCQYLLYRLLDVQRRGVQKICAWRLLQWRYVALSISLVTDTYIQQKGRDISIDSFFHQLLISSLGACLGAGGQKDFQLGVREHHRAHVASIGHQSRRAAECMLLGKQCSAHLRHGSYF
jgi:hypothetical protein